MKKIIVYSISTCGYCVLAKEFLSSHNVPFEDKNVAEDARAREEMIAKTHQTGVPVFDVDGKILIGFDVDELEKMVGIK